MGKVVDRTGRLAEKNPWQTLGAGLAEARQWAAEAAEAAGAAPVGLT